MSQPSSLPSLIGETFLVTGGNTGIGYETCLHFAAHGAPIYTGVRSLSRGSAAITKIKATYPDAPIQNLLMDHDSLQRHYSSRNLQIQRGVSSWPNSQREIMGVPDELNKDGFESQM
jgi:NAD(P)-dependent dehydrogenase (short-subunit alcohol dehydrogenase family)